MAQSTLKFHRQAGTPQSTMLSEVLESVLTMFRGRLRTMGIAVNLDAQLEFPIECMPSETQQIFANFIANSIEAIQEDGRIVIRLRPSHDWRNRNIRGIRVTICDNGEGIEPTSLSHIYEPFFTTKPETGTGLGLWVVAELLERHKGTAHVRSSRKAGATGTAFSIFLPEGDVSTRKDDAHKAQKAISTPDIEKAEEGVAPQGF